MNVVKESMGKIEVNLKSQNVLGGIELENNQEKLSQCWYHRNLPLQCIC